MRMERIEYIFNVKQTRPLVFSFRNKKGTQSHYVKHGEMLHSENMVYQERYPNAMEAE
jgi:hypothetical protein